ncbi:MAG: Lipid carrier--UDP-N-acetylgalactosaminyltransferase [uncultured Sulfurovum sp.]|uniref:Lipid carrier--UDP-N-acetylgalactosaminyltransferase n=1 Tax=uncultured Sulfurovum sp. TaxID=269237 RepID=A0A6S6SZW3_9BACT|nr:MAG: Lipid carrier--UDP-N-acetylgalactosaminyltransferase [uncultured Sulfurovum sp.]
MQRFLDITLSSFALILLSPLLLCISIILKTTGNKVFYRQKRVGVNGVAFDVLKFTTMIENSENMGTGTITLKDDSRVLPIGKFLRKSKLNELPQLMNILQGDMSLIGPRPQDIIGFNAFNLKEQKIIIQVRPGLSGIGPIFFRNEDEIMERASIIDKKEFYVDYIAPYKGKIEAWYVENKSLYLYLRLIFMTLYVVFVPRNKIDYLKVFKNFPTPPKELSPYL